jgi:Tfp pilus assembly protein PilF
VRRAARRLRLARYWQTDGDLDEAATHARRALRLMQTRGPAVPLELAVDVATSAAHVERDRDNPVASRAALDWVVDLLDAAPVSPRRDQLLSRVLVDLGDWHRRAAQYPLAVETLYRARRLTQAAGSAEPVHEAALLTMLGIVAKETGAFGCAADWYAAAGNILDQAGASPVDAASLQHNLAGLAHARQQYPQAESYARRAVELRRQASGVTEVDVAADIAVLAAAIAGQHRYDEARSLFMQAMTACREGRPPRRYEIAVHLHYLAAIDQATGRPDRAERQYRQALAIKEDLLGPEHPEVGLVANNLGTLLCEQKRQAEAVACYRRALTIAERVYPPQHPVTDAIRHNLNRAE